MGLDELIWVLGLKLIELIPLWVCLTLSTVLSSYLYIFLAFYEVSISFLCSSSTNYRYINEFFFPRFIRPVLAAAGVCTDVQHKESVRLFLGYQMKI